MWDSTCLGIRVPSTQRRLKTKKVTVDTMKSYNASEALLGSYTKNLVIAAALQDFGMSDIADEPTQHKFEFGISDESTTL